MTSLRLGCWRSSWAPAVLLLTAALGAAGCSGETPTPPPVIPPDTHPPVLTIVYPSEAYGAYDRDSNGLLDLEVAWRDSAGAVNPASLRITCSDCLPGISQDTNFAVGWRTARRDTVGAVLEETIPLLMRSGSHLLRVTVTDTAGNRSTEKLVYLNLPPGAFHRAIDLAYPATWQQVKAAFVAVTADGHKGFVPFTDGHLAVFDPDGVTPTHYIGPITNSFPGAQISLDEATGLAYIGGGGAETPGFQVVDTRTEQPLAWYSVGMGLAGVHVEGNRIFVGESCTNGRIIVLDKMTMQELGRVEVGATPFEAVCTNTRTFALTSDGHQGWGGLVDAGLVWFDAQTYAVIQRFDLEPSPGTNNYGNVRDIRLLNDRWLYLARVCEGLDEWDVQNRNVRTGRYDGLIKELTLSPDGRLLFASASPDCTLSGSYTRAPLLFEVPGLRLRYAFPQRPGAISDGAVFHPDGKRVYVMAEFNVDVYLIRPM